MKTMSVREIRHEWPRAEKALGEDGEIIVTRDSKPVARILPYVPSAKGKRKQFDPEEHMRWLRKISKGEPPQPSTDEWLRREREDEHPDPTS